MPNVIYMEKYRKTKRLEKRLKETQDVLRATKRFYTEIQPLFKYKLMYDMGKEVIQFRKDLLYNIKEMKRELEN